MYTNSNEYYAMLYRIQDENSPLRKYDEITRYSGNLTLYFYEERGVYYPIEILSESDFNTQLLTYGKLYRRRSDYISPLPIPSDEPIMIVDLNQRTIQAPEYLSVQYDHHAETVFFIVDRYFDSVDLATKTGIVQYKNALKEDRIFIIPYYDTTYAENKIVFPWCISGEATKAAGIVEFSVRFYEVDIDNRCFLYNLNTQPAKSKVLHGMNSTIPEEYCSLDVQFEQEVLDRLARVEKSYNLFWLDVEEMQSEGGE